MDARPVHEKKNRKRIKALPVTAVAAILVVLPVAFGQHGTARNLQNGSLHDTWLRIVVSTDDATREITLRPVEENPRHLLAS